MAKKKADVIQDVEEMSVAEVMSVYEEKGEPKVIAGLTEGRIVHIVLPNGQHRPAIIVNVLDHGTGLANLQVLMDGPNDGHAPNDGVQWQDFIYFSEEATPGTWHWIEKA